MRHSTITHPLADHAGVYSFSNLDTGCVYIGSTARAFRGRWVAHLRNLEDGTHNCALLQQAWAETSHDRFQFDVIEIVGKDDARKREQKAIDEFRAKGVALYNGNRAYTQPLDTYTDDELFTALYHLLPSPL